MHPVHFCTSVVITAGDAFAMRSVTTPSSSSASTNSYISFPKGSACLLDDQDWSYSSCANGATTAGAAAECAAAYSEANSGGGGGIGCFGQSKRQQYSM